MMKKFEKENFKLGNLSVTRFANQTFTSELIFVHGGPGYNSGITQYLIEYENLFNTLKYNLVFYDQRECGKSFTSSMQEVTHQDNINDLNAVYKYLIEEKKLSIKGIIGHSYGGKLLYDYYEKYQPQTSLIFVGIGLNMLIPRMNSMMIDLAYLKSKDKKEYQKILSSINNFDKDNLWKLTEELSYLVRDNENRPYLYWTNLEWLEKFQSAMKKVNLPINMQVLNSVRKDFYLNGSNLSINVELLKVPYLWINGAHDLIMNANNDLFDKNLPITFFYQSSHYPHVEENEKFCEKVNDFIKSFKI